MLSAEKSRNIPPEFQGRRVEKRGEGAQKKRGKVRVFGVMTSSYTKKKKGRRKKRGEKTSRKKPMGLRGGGENSAASKKGKLGGRKTENIEGGCEVRGKHQVRGPIVGKKGPIAFSPQGL